MKLSLKQYLLSLGHFSDKSRFIGSSNNLAEMRYIRVRVQPPLECISTNKSDFANNHIFLQVHFSSKCSFRVLTNVSFY